jgi:DivIVA domain-containing protein
MKERDVTQDTSGWDGSPQAALSPLDVQQKEFRVARFGAGYRMREVDEFLDRVTDALSALIAENDRLKRTSAEGSPAPIDVRPAGDGDRAAVDAFLRTEKGFLQDLGALVQSHAEELKTMVRSARRDTPPAEAARTELEDAAAAEDDRPPADVESASPPGGSAEVPQEEEVVPDEAPVAENEDTMASSETEDVAAAEPEDVGEDSVTGVIAEEPIRLGEPEPARSGRVEDDRDGSLRELFWGEE